MSGKKVKLRVCASCEWVFRNAENCPKCGFAYYSARHVYGNKCYRFEKTQEPWINKKVAAYIEELHEQI